MTAYVIQRVALTLPVILLAVTLVFLAGHAVPDYAVRSIAAGLTGAENLEQAKQQVRHDLGLDKPILQQYGEYVGGVFKGDLGDSYITKQPVLTEMKRRMPVSVELGLLTVLVALPLAVVFGVISAIRQDTWLDYVVRFLSILGLAIPSFYLGVILLIFVFKVFDWAPPLTTTGYRNLLPSPLGASGLEVDPVQNLKQMALPAIAGGLALSAGMMRLLRSQMLEVLRQDFVRTAWAKGLRERTIIFRHVLKNAMIPVFTFAGLEVGILFSGEIVLEWMFSIPGMGVYTVMAIKQSDFPAAQGIVLVVATALAVTNLLVDLTYGWLDPRVRYQ
jgi:peptide/nickel transport system permease protein